MPITLSRSDARRMLVSHLGLHRSEGSGAAAARRVLERLRCIQLDPLDAIGTNADLVVMARVDGAKRGEVWRHLFPSHAFEHFAKERCILPASAFPFYRQQGHAAQTPWWRHGEREKRLPAKLVRAVLDEIRAHGPVTAREITDHGSVEPLDWSGWKGTAKATTMALEILWTQCDVVVAGRNDSREKLYDVPERALGADALREPEQPFDSWALRERAHAAGLLTRASGAMWSMLSALRTSPRIDEMIERGELVEVAIEDSARRYLTTPEFLTPPTRAGGAPALHDGDPARRRRVAPAPGRPQRFDDRVRILGPLDPLLWDRGLVSHVFGFDYVWEVYKPERQRKWGWYVCPLLFRDRLIGRVDARIDRGALVVRRLWIEDDDAPMDAVATALERHAAACGASRVRMPRRGATRVSSSS